MKRTCNIIFLFLCFLTQGQETPEIKVIARELQDKIMLRWALNEPYAWKKANEYGFLVERVTISRNDEAVLPLERKMLTPYPLLPKPIEEWENIAINDQNAAIIAQALYGEEFEVGSHGGGMAGIMAINEELEQRFTFSLLAAEQNYEAAKMAGWGYEDHTALPGEKYMYVVSVNYTLQDYKIQEGSVYASTDFYKELPKPIGLVSVFKDQAALLNWNFTMLQDIYSSYFVERSTDNRSFNKLNGTPLFNVEEKQAGRQVSLFYADSITNNKTYYYRVKGVTSFGQIGPTSEVTSGMGQPDLEYTPHITDRKILDEKTVELHWEFPIEAEGYISGFELNRANTGTGVFEPVLMEISPNTRKIIYNKLKPSNYFSVVALGKNGDKLASLPVLVQPIDSIPPNPPMVISAVADTLGIVKIQWQPNTEEDLSGYRVYRANNVDEEFSQITRSIVREPNYNDTVQVRNLNKKIFYKIKAEDFRYNLSGFSEVIVVEKPDLVPPSPPVISNYEIIDEGIRISWTISSSDDTVKHVIFKKEIENDDELWLKVSEIEISENPVFVDTEVKPGTSYSYTVIAMDASGNESVPANPLTIRVPREFLAEGISRFDAIVNRDLRYINLSWNSKDKNISEYMIYRAEETKPLALYKTFDSAIRNYNDTYLNVNTNYTYGIQLIFKDGSSSRLKKINVKY